MGVKLSDSHARRLCNDIEALFTEEFDSPPLNISIKDAAFTANTPIKGREILDMMRRLIDQGWSFRDGKGLTSYDVSSFANVVRERLGFSVVDTTPVGGGVLYKVVTW